MDLVSDDKILKVSSGAQKEEGSDFVEKLDLNLDADKDKEGNTTYTRGNATWNDSGHEMEIDFTQQEPQGPESLLTKPGSLSESESPDPDCLHYAAGKTNKSSILDQNEVYQDDADNRNLGSALERLPSPPKDHHSSGECEAASSGDYTDKSSYPLQRESCHDDKKSTDTLLPVVANARNEVMMETHDSDGAKSPCDGEMNKYSNHFLVNPGLNMNSACENENYHHSNKRSSSLRVELEKENFENSYKLPTANGEIEVGNLDLDFPGNSCKQSVSPVKLISASPNSSMGKQLLSPVKGPTMDDGTRVRLHDCLSPAAKGESVSQRMAKTSKQRVHSPHTRVSVSPKGQYSSQGHQRQTRSTSRSPIRRRASPHGYRRDYRDRSRSTSPHGQDHDRPPRRRHSPGRRSPRRYHSRRSPKRKPWSPPPNRSTGVGRPGKNLFVAGFSFITTERDLERKFSRFGRVTGVRIVRDKRTGDSRGFGFLSLERDEDADAAIRALDQTEWNGRIVLKHFPPEDDLEQIKQSSSRLPSRSACSESLVSVIAIPTTFQAASLAAH